MPGSPPHRKWFRSLQVPSPLMPFPFLQHIPFALLSLFHIILFYLLPTSLRRPPLSLRASRPADSRKTALIVPSTPTCSSRIRKSLACALPDISCSPRLGLSEFYVDLHSLTACPPTPNRHKFLGNQPGVNTAQRLFGLRNFIGFQRSGSCLPALSSHGGSSVRRGTILRRRHSQSVTGQWGQLVLSE